MGDPTAHGAPRASAGRTPPKATWRLATAAERPGAIAVLQLRGEIDDAFARAGIRGVPVGGMAVRDLAGVDRGVVARVRGDLALVMPHGGREVVRQLAAALAAAGVQRDRDGSAIARFPEASSAFQAELLDALARAASPVAVDLLLAQPARWREHLGREPGLDEPAPDPEHSHQLNALIDPPMVVAVGASNIGKSTLLNRLSGRAVVAVADEPGTTRDHVGSLVDLDGVVVRWVDTPGRRADAPAAEAEALALAEALLAGADLVIRLGDRDHRPPEVPCSTPGVTVGLRRDLGEPTWPHDLAVSALTEDGIGSLAGLLRRRLLSDGALASALPWRFWG